MFAVIGAVAGALVGGPVGLFAGAKLGEMTNKLSSYYFIYLIKEFERRR